MKGEVSISNWYLEDPKQSQVDLVHVCAYRFKRFLSTPLFFQLAACQLLDVYHLIRGSAKD